MRRDEGRQHSLQMAGKVFATLRFDVGDHSYATSFFTITGFHGLHLLAGVIALAVLIGRSLARGFDRSRLPAAEVTSYYWHFVDGVWIAVLVLLFACSDIEIGRTSPTETPSGARAARSRNAAALETTVCETLRRELGDARARLAADSSNVRLKGRAEALGALTKDACGLAG